MDERYERSADMRLIDFEREARGVPARVLGLTIYSDPDALADLEQVEDEAYSQGGTILIATIDAQPRAALIPGALVTVSFSVANEGDAPATRVRMSLPLPADTAYRAGTFTLDGAAESDAIANELFGNGADLGDIAPGARRTLTVKLVVEGGANDIRLSPHLSAATGAVVGLRAMRLSRRAAIPRDAVAERPFYESDAVEHLEEPLAPAAKPPTITVLQPREVPPLPVPPSPRSPIFASPRSPIEAPPPPIHVSPAAQIPASPPLVEASPPRVPLPKPAVPILAAVAAKLTPGKDQIGARQPTATKVPVIRSQSAPPVLTQPVAEAKPKPKPRAKPKAKPKEKAPTPAMPLVAVESVPRPKVEVVRSVDDRLSLTAQGGPILTVAMDRKRLSTLAGFFSGASFGMIAHYLVLNALAVKDALPGDGADGSIATFVAEQERLLLRALINTRLGKTPSSESVSATLPAFPATLTTYAEQRTVELPPHGQVMLLRAFKPAETAFLQRTLSNEKSAPFMRAAQLFVGLCANDVVVADERQRRNLSVALSAYAALATGEISRIFLRAQATGMPALFKTTDTSFDDAARTVLAALGSTLA